MLASMPIAIGPIVCLLLGLAALLRPERVGGRVGLVAEGALGRAELRAVFGGVSIGIAIACLVTAGPAAYLTGGAAFLGGALAKLGSALVERSVFPAALPGLAMDLVIGGLFVYGARALHAAA